MNPHIKELQAQITTSLDQIDQWRRETVANEPEEWRPDLSERHPGASRAEVEELSQAVEMTTDHPLPDDVVALLLLHNGETEDRERGEPVTTFPLGLRALSVAEITRDWQQNCEIVASCDVGPPDLPVEHDPRLKYTASPPSLSAIPITGSIGLSYNFFIDLDPGPEGNLGQIIYNANEIAMVVLGSSLVDFLDRYAEALADGRFIFDGEFIVQSGGAIEDALSESGGSGGGLSDY